MKPMTAKKFDTIQPRDLENGAIRDSIRIVLQEQQKLTVTEKDVQKLADRMREYPSYRRIEWWLNELGIRVSEK